MIHAQKRDIGSIFKISSSNIARTCFTPRTVEFNSMLIMAGSPDACKNWINTLTKMHRSLRNRFTSYSMSHRLLLLCRYGEDGILTKKKLWRRFLYPNSASPISIRGWGPQLETSWNHNMLWKPLNFILIGTEVFHGVKFWTCDKTWYYDTWYKCDKPLTGA